MRFMCRHRKGFEYGFYEQETKICVQDHDQGLTGLEYPIE